MEHVRVLTYKDLVVSLPHSTQCMQRKHGRRIRKSNYVLAGTWIILKIYRRLHARRAIRKTRIQNVLSAHDAAASGFAPVGFVDARLVVETVIRPQTQILVAIPAICHVTRIRCTYKHLTRSPRYPGMPSSTRSSRSSGSYPYTRRCIVETSPPMPSLPRSVNFSNIVYAIRYVSSASPPGMYDGSR